MARPRGQLLQLELALALALELELELELALWQHAAAHVRAALLQR